MLWAALHCIDVLFYTKGPTTSKTRMRGIVGCQRWFKAV